MLRFVTIKNVALLESQLERAWRRRCDAVCDYLEEMEDEALLKVLHDRRKRAEKSREWLRRLALEMDALSEKPLEPSTRRRRASQTRASTDHALKSIRGGRRDAGR